MKSLLILIVLVLLGSFPGNATPLHLQPIGPAFACRSIAHAEHCVVINVQGYEVATTLSIPNSFSPNTTIQSALMNSNFSTIATWANGNVDSTNVGTAGINPVKVLCTSTATCTFGSAQAYIFPQNVVFNANAATSPTLVAIWNDNGGTNGMVLNVPTASTNGIQLTVNAVVFGELSAAGDFQVAPLINGVHTLARITPVYSISGADIGASMHEVIGQLATTLNGNCPADTVCTLTANTITFTNAAVFADANYRCSLVSTNAVANFPFGVWSIDQSTKLTTGFTLALANPSNASIAGGSPVKTDFDCVGK
jgi:hypothetical protein